MNSYSRGPVYAPDGLSDAAPFDATAAFEANLNVPAEADNEPRKAPEPEPVETPDKEPVEAPEGTEPAPIDAPDDDPEVELPFGEETRKFKLKELNALIEEHAALKPQASKAAEQALAAQQERERLSAAYDGMLKRAQERYAPYAGIDWLALSRDPSIDQETFTQIRADAQAAHADLNYLNSEVQAAMQGNAQKAEAARHEAAKACAAELKDPVKGIKGFDGALYSKIVDYGKANGVPDAGQIIEPHLIKLLHKAYQFDQGATKVDAQVQKVVNTPSKVIRPGSKPVSDDSNKATATKALKALRANPNDSDAITNAFMASL